MSHFQVQFVDVVIALIVFWNLWQGYKWGLARMFFSLAGIFIAIFVALAWYSQAGAYLNKECFVPLAWAEFLGFSCIWLTVSCFFNFIGYIFKKILESIFLGWLDSLGGAVLGLGKGLFIVSLVLISLTRLPLTPAIKVYLNNSYLAPPLLKTTPLIYLHVTKFFKDNNSASYALWYSQIQKIYQDTVLSH